VLLVLLVNLALLGGSAWLVYSLLQRYHQRPAPLLKLGAPRLVRVAPQPTPPGPVAAQDTTTPTRPRAGVPATGKRSAAATTGPRGDAGRAPAPSGKAAAPAETGGGLAVAKKPAATGSGTTAKPPAAKQPDPPSESGEPSADEVRAGLDAESVRMVVQHHLPQVRACSDRALKQQDTIGGVVEVKFEISSEGKVSSSSVHRNTTGHEGLGKCIATVLKSWRFPRPIGGEAVFVYPFVFASGE